VKIKDGLRLTHRCPRGPGLASAVDQLRADLGHLLADTHAPETVV
jgi:hypothetical protein